MTARRLGRQVAILAVALWAVALVNAWTPTRYLRSGQVKGTDFVQFYTLGRAAADARYLDLFDAEALHRVQTQAVPESAGDFYPALYGPQVGILLAPVGRLSYGAALTVWAGFTIVLYLSSVAFVARRTLALRPFVGLSLLGGVAYPPFTLLVQNGHLTVVAMAALVGAWAALRGGHAVAAGICLGLLAFKPQLVAPVVVLLLSTGSWRMLWGLALGVVLQFLPALVVLGTDALTQYWRLLAVLPGQASTLITRPEQFQGWRGFWSLLVADQSASVGLFLVSAVATVLVAVRAWRSHRNPSVRASVVGLSIALTAPHLYAYDLVILAPVWLWLVDWHLTRDVPDRWFARLLWLGFLSPLLGPIVALVRIQFVVPVLMALLVMLARYRAPGPAAFEGA